MVMTDREKIIKALTECIFLHENPDDDAGCFECPYRPDEKGTCPTMIPFLKDVLELLEEQEPVKVRYLHGTKVSMHEEIVFTYECGNCSGYLLKPWKSCPICGRAVKWDDD